MTGMFNGTSERQIEKQVSLSKFEQDRKAQRTKTVSFTRFDPSFDAGLMEGVVEEEEDGELTGPRCLDLEISLGMELSQRRTEFRRSNKWIPKRLTFVYRTRTRKDLSRLRNRFYPPSF